MRGYSITTHYGHIYNWIYRTVRLICRSSRADCEIGRFVDHHAGRELRAAADDAEKMLIISE
jgi:hypothetical protein